MRDDINLLYDYAEALSGPIPDYLLQLERATFLRTLAPQMMSGRLQGRLLALLSKLHRPKRILELGTFTGYSALCLAEGLLPDGQLDTIEGNLEMAAIARQFFDASPFKTQLQLHTENIDGSRPIKIQSETGFEAGTKCGSQVDSLLARLLEKGTYDIIFLDADKRHYANYFQQLLPHLQPGGLFISDNVLWDGRVIHPADTDPDVQALAAYNQLLANDSRVELLLLPLRDGLSIARKK